MSDSPPCPVPAGLELILPCSSLAVGGTLTVPTRIVSGSLVEGNIAQCKTVMSNDTKFGIENSPIVPGEFALSAIDGANAVRTDSLGIRTPKILILNSPSSL